jgi:hypothetical protein
MVTECPANTVDEHAARIVASMVVALALCTYWAPASGLIGLLAIDFTIRGFGNRRYSPLRWIAKTATAAMGWEPKPVYAPPKRFAAQIGSALTIVATLLLVTGLHVAALVVIAALLVAASLEAGLGFCLACWIHPLVFRTRGEARA